MTCPRALRFLSEPHRLWSYFGTSYQRGQQQCLRISISRKVANFSARSGMASSTLHALEISSVNTALEIPSSDRRMGRFTFPDARPPKDFKKPWPAKCATASALMSSRCPVLSTVKPHPADSAAVIPHGTARLLPGLSTLRQPLRPFQFDQAFFLRYRGPY